MNIQVSCEGDELVRWKCRSLILEDSDSKVADEVLAAVTDQKPFKGKSIQGDVGHLKDVPMDVANVCILVPMKFEILLCSKSIVHGASEKATFQFS